MHDTRVTKRQRNQGKHCEKDGDVKKRKEGDADGGGEGGGGEEGGAEGGVGDKGGGSVVEEPVSKAD